jgi:putative lumazine-binding protein
MSDREAVERVVADYYESWFTGDGVRMRAGLHPQLAKRALMPEGEKRLDLDTISAEEMADLAAAGAGTRYPRGHHVDLCDIDGDLASVKVTSAPYVEYLHLARFGERWLIVNILWRRRNESAPAG